MLVTLRAVRTLNGAVALVVFNVVKLSSPLESIFSCCFLANLFLLLSPNSCSTLYHILWKKLRGMNFGRNVAL